MGIGVSEDEGPYLGVLLRRIVHVGGSTFAPLYLWTPPHTYVIADALPDHRPSTPNPLENTERSLFNRYRAKGAL